MHPRIIKINFNTINKRTLDQEEANWVKIKTNFKISQQARALSKLTQTFLKISMYSKI